MGMIYGILYLGVTALLIWKILSDEVRGRVPLASARNVFLGGFIIFQLTSAMYAVFGQLDLRYPLRDISGTLGLYIIYVILFLAMFFWGYKIWKPARRLTGWFNIRHTQEGASVPHLIVLGLVVTVLGFVMQYAVMVPLIGTLSLFTGVGLACIGAGIGGWLWAPRLHNPVYAAFAGFLLLANFISTNAGGYGRRDELAVLLCFAWGMYHAHFRYKRLSSYLPVVVSFGLVAMLALGALSSVRGQTREAGIQERLRMYVFESDPIGAASDFWKGQAAGQVSMWLIENFPEPYPHTYFRTFKYFFQFPIPRSIYPGKPDTLSGEIAVMVDLDGVNQEVGAKSGINVGPGIIGTAHADGHFFMIIFYGAVIGFGMRLADQLILDKPYNMFIVLPIGTQLGDLIGAPRGGFSPMMFQYVWSVASCLVIMAIIPKILLFPKRLPHHDAYGDTWYDDPDGGGYGDYDDTGDADDGYGEAAYDNPDGHGAFTYS